MSEDNKAVTISETEKTKGMQKPPTLGSTPRKGTEKDYTSLDIGEKNFKMVNHSSPSALGRSQTLLIFCLFLLTGLASIEPTLRIPVCIIIVVVIIVIFLIIKFDKESIVMTPPPLPPQGDKEKGEVIDGESYYPKIDVLKAKKALKANNKI